MTLTVFIYDLLFGHQSFYKSSSSPVSPNRIMALEMFSYRANWRTGSSGLGIGKTNPKNWVLKWSFKTQFTVIQRQAGAGREMAPPPLAPLTGPPFIPIPLPPSPRGNCTSKFVHPSITRLLRLTVTLFVFHSMTYSTVHYAGLMLNLWLIQNGSNFGFFNWIWLRYGVFTKIWRKKVIWGPLGVPKDLMWAHWKA